MCLQGLDRAPNLLSKGKVGLKEGLDGSNILPVVVEQVGLDAVVAGSRWDDLAAEVIGLWVAVLEQLHHEVLFEDIDAHGGNVWLLCCLGLAQTCTMQQDLSLAPDASGLCLPGVSGSAFAWPSMQELMMPQPRLNL